MITLKKKANPLTHVPPSDPLRPVSTLPREVCESPALGLSPIPPQIGQSCPPLLRRALEQQQPPPQALSPGGSQAPSVAERPMAGGRPLPEGIEVCRRRGAAVAVRPKDPAPELQPLCSQPMRGTGDSASAEHWTECPERGPLRERPPTGISSPRGLACFRSRQLRRLGPRDDPAS